MTCLWRPSMFAPRVVHLVQGDSVPVTSREYKDERWIWAACGQRTHPEHGESFDSIRCPECLTWLERNRVQL